MFFSLFTIIVVLKKSIQLNKQSVCELYSDVEEKKKDREDRRAYGKLMNEL